MHYNQGIGGWNGYCTLAEFYAMFEGDADNNAPGSGQEERRGFVPGINESNETNNGIGYGFLVGQQYNGDGTKTKDRTGNDLIFTKRLSWSDW